MRQWLLLIVLVGPGVGGFLFGLYHALQDWAALQKAYIHFEQVAAASAGTSSSAASNMNALFVAEARQNMHRINVFADVVWALLAAILAAIGFHGLCMLPLHGSGYK